MSLQYQSLESFEKFIKYILSTDSIVEIGCGNGKNMLRLKNLGYKFVKGCDKSEEFIGICKSNNLNVIDGNIIDLPYQNNEFDITLCIEVLHHLETIELRIKAIEELIRITKNGGLIFIVVNANQEFNICSDTDLIIKQVNCNLFYHLFNMYELTELFKNVNYCEKIYETYECLHRIGIIQIKKY